MRTISVSIRYVAHQAPPLDIRQPRTRRHHASFWLLVYPLPSQPDAPGRCTQHAALRGLRVCCSASRCRLQLNAAAPKHTQAQIPVATVDVPVDPRGRYEGLPTFSHFGEGISFVGGINKPKRVVCFDRCCDIHVLHSALRCSARTCAELQTLLLWHGGKADAQACI